ncbi:hypothetical protein [Halobaculum magnesiiphilum]|uniref:Uncharacterized protein n=1 Tax=Halobaculum magnesiiphilum TaxID=1017351 RepID=A0A8T8WBW8_9EURY|nr:hypothetical protein [Halobaculum magnesiiphilum]QZP37347.1 hypothetical protein K6T50_13850 [Halobaculum magnesiiphilum]
MSRGAEFSRRIASDERDGVRERREHHQADENQREHLLAVHGIEFDGTDKTVTFTE